MRRRSGIPKWIGLLGVGLLLVGSVWFLLFARKPPTVRGVRVGLLLPGEGELGPADFTPDGGHLISTVRGIRETIVWELVRGSGVQTFRVPRWPVSRAQFSPDSRWVAIVDRNRGLEVYSVPAGRLAWNDADASDCTWISSANGFAALVSHQDSIDIRSAASGAVLETVAMTELQLDSWPAAPSADGRRLATFGRSLSVLELETLNITRSDEAPNEAPQPPYSIRWSPDGKWIATGGHASMIGPHYVKIYAADSCELRYSFAGHGGPIAVLAWASSSEYLVTAVGAKGWLGTPTMLEVIDLSSGKIVRRLKGGWDQWIAGVWTETDSTFTGVQRDGAVWRWDLSGLRSK